MKNSHCNLCKTLSLDDALCSLQGWKLPHPSVEDLAPILLTCRKEKDRTRALHLHAYLLRHGLETHPSLGNYLVSMLVENGSMLNAQQVFDRLGHPNEWSYNAIITGYVKCGQPQHAFTIYHDMHRDASVYPTVHTYVALLKACSKLKDFGKGLELHGKISVEGLLEKNAFVGSALVDMYAKLGALDKAQQVFNELPMRDVVSWTALIVGYVEHENGESGLYFYEQMHCEGVFPDPVTLICILKACAITGNIKKGQFIHLQIEGLGQLQTNHIFGNALIDMYTKCRSLPEAERVFEKIPTKDVVLWNALITGYVNHGYGKKALDCFKQLQFEGICPNAITFVCCLKACVEIGAIDKGEELHLEIERQGLLERNIFISSTLVDMYGKFGLLAKAQGVFDKIPSPNVITWTALISGYADHGFSKEALGCFEDMEFANVVPNSMTFVCALKACANLGAIDQGLELHAEIERRGSLQNIYVGSALVDMYSKCGLLAKAHEVFDKLPGADLVSWNALIAGYAEYGHGVEALECFERMQDTGVSPNDVTFLCCFKACGSIGAMYKGIEMHAEVERRGLLIRNSLSNSTLIDMYASFFLLARAREVFDRLPNQDLVAWNALISGYVESGYGEEALKCYEQMQLKGVCPDAATLVCSLKASASIGATDKCQEIHAEIERQGLLEKDTIVGNVLVDTLAKCNLVAKAQEVFDKLHVRNVFAWTALAGGYAEQGHDKEVLECFEHMKHEGVVPNAHTFACSLKACGSIKAVDKGRDIHGEIERQGLVSGDFVVGNILVDMYTKFGFPEVAKQVFDMLEVQDIVSWTALIAGFAEHGQDKEALECFEQMQLEGISPDALTLICGLKACGNLGALDKGEEIHSEIERRGLLMKHLVIGNTLVDMYAKCGSLFKARSVFDRLPDRDVVSWTALMTGYTQLGDGDSACVAFKRMIREGIKPDPVTFLVVLSACSRAGLFDRSQTYYEAMTEDYGLVPMFEHQACVADSLGRAGQIDKVVAMMEGMQQCDAVEVWHTVLSSCRLSGNVGVGQCAFDHAMGLQKQVSLAPAFTSHIYADADLEVQEKQVKALSL